VVLALFFPYVDEAFYAEWLTLADVRLGPVQKFMGRHFKIDSILHVRNVGCIEDCSSPEFASQTTGYHVCASYI
jgi:hypothetical protein